MTPESIATSLGGAKRKPDGGYMAQCPCHDDRHASLSIDQKDEKILLHCFAGCNYKSIVEVLKERGVWQDNGGKQHNHKDRIVASYHYKTADGQVAYTKARWEPKRFSFSHQLHEKIINTRGHEPLPYNLPDVIQADTFVVVEGEKDADRLMQCGIVATTLDSGASSPVSEELIKAAQGKVVVLMPDNDGPGRQYTDRIGEALQSVANVHILALPDLPSKGDVSDWLDSGGSAGQLVQLIKDAPEWKPKGTKTASKIEALDIIDFMCLELPPRENVLAPWLPQQGLAMVYAPRGIGKTHFSLGTAYAVASAGEFLGWQADKARGVMFLDGEMPAAALQERLSYIINSSSKEPTAPLKLITPDLQPSRMIDLTRIEDQEELEPELDGIDLIIVDNLSTLCRTGKESEGEGWLPVQQWALRQRASGRSVLFIHHAGKNGEQRGTSRREDVLDTVIALKRPGDYTPDKGACFEVHFEKARGLYGDETKPFEVQLMMSPDGVQTWSKKSMEKSTAEKVAQYLNDGMKQSDIADLMGITKGAVSKAKKKASELGLLKEASC